MLVRLVKMTFQTDKAEAFKAFFEERKDKIRHFEGCLHLELWQDTIYTNIFFTYSLWTNKAALTHYRSSTFFSETWHQTRQMFAAKAEAWSADPVAALP